MEALKLEPLVFVGYQVQPSPTADGPRLSNSVHFVTPQGAHVLLRPSLPPPAPSSHTPQTSAPSSQSSPPPPSALPSSKSGEAANPKGPTVAKKALPTPPPPPPSASKRAPVEDVDASLKVLTSATAPPANFQVEFVLSSSSSSSSSSASSRSASPSTPPEIPDTVTPRRNGSDSPQQPKQLNEKSSAESMKKSEKREEGTTTTTATETDAELLLTSKKILEADLESMTSDEACVPLNYEHGTELVVKADAGPALDAALTQCALTLFNGKLPQQQQEETHSDEVQKAPQPPPPLLWSEAAHYHRVIVMGYSDTGAVLLMALPFAQPVPPPQSWRLCPLPLLLCPLTQLPRYYVEDTSLPQQQSASRAGEGKVATATTAAELHRYPVLPRAAGVVENRSASATDSRGASPLPSSLSSASALPHSVPPPPPPPPPKAGPRLPPPPPPSSASTSRHAVSAPASFYLSPPLRWASAAVGHVPALDLARLFDVVPGQVYQLAQPPEEVVFVGVACGVPWIREVTRAAAAPSAIPTAGRGVAFPPHAASTSSVVEVGGTVAVSAGQPPSGYRWKDPRGVAVPLVCCHEARDLRGRHGLQDRHVNAAAGAVPSQQPPPPMPQPVGEAEAADTSVKEKKRDKDEAGETPQKDAASAATPPRSTSNTPLATATTTTTPSHAPASASKSTTAPLYVKEGTMVFVPGRFGILLECVAKPAVLEAQFGVHHGDRLAPRPADDGGSSAAAARSPVVTVMGLFKRNVLVVLADGESQATEVTIRNGVAEVAALFRKVGGAVLPPPALPLEGPVEEERDDTVQFEQHASADSDVGETRETAEAKGTPECAAETHDAARATQGEDQPQQPQQHPPGVEELPAEAVVRASVTSADEAPSHPTATAIFVEANASRDDLTGAGCGLTTPDAAEGDPDKASPLPHHLADGDEDDDDDGGAAELGTGVPPANAQGAPMFASTHRTPATSSASSAHSRTPIQDALERQRQTPLAEGNEESVAAKRTIHDERVPLPTAPVTAAEAEAEMGAAALQHTISAEDTSAEAEEEDGGEAGAADAVDGAQLRKLNGDDVDDDDDDDVTIPSPTLPQLAHAEDVTITSASVTPTSAVPPPIASTRLAVAEEVALKDEEGEDKSEQAAGDARTVTDVADSAEQDSAMSTNHETHSMSLINNNNSSSSVHGSSSAAAAPPPAPRSVHPSFVASQLLSTEEPEMKAPQHSPSQQFHPPQDSSHVYASLTSAHVVDTHEFSGSAQLLSSDHTPSILPTPSMSLARRLLSEQPYHEDETATPAAHGDFMFKSDDAFGLQSEEKEACSAAGEAVAVTPATHSKKAPHVPRVPIEPTADKPSAAHVQPPHAVHACSMAEDLEPIHTAATVVTTYNDSSVARSSESPAAVMPESYYAELSAAAAEPPHRKGTQDDTPSDAARHAPHLGPPPPSLLMANTDASKKDLATPPTQNVAGNALYHEVFTPSYSPPAGIANGGGGHTVPRYAPPGDVQSYHAASMSSSQPSAAAAAASVVAVNPRPFSMMTAATTSVASAAVTPTPFTNFLKAYAIYALQLQQREEGKAEVSLPGLAPLLDFYREQPLRRMTAATEGQRRCRAAWCSSSSAALQLFRRHASTSAFDELCVDELVTLLTLV